MVFTKYEIEILAEFIDYDRMSGFASEDFLKNIIPNMEERLEGVDPKNYPQEFKLLKKLKKLEDERKSGDK